MKIVVNGKEESLTHGKTLAELVSNKGLVPHNIIIEYNLQLVKETEWSNIILKENDRVEILRFVGGG